MLHLYMILLQLTLMNAFVMDISTYVALAVALSCLAVAFLLFWFVRGIDSNANSIRTNLVASLFVTYAVFVAGIDRTNQSLQVLFVLTEIGLNKFCFLMAMKIVIFAATVVKKYCLCITFLHTEKLQRCGFCY